ncbi:hypothetical protein MSAN_00824000 [Mycena sanguinolenta]|uniref:Uncharacterized protein n=1 Tax=Mycena sanguinolenta TaxID=230812 RepID=A0A8H6YZF6_9AGAR|nr:hypothetical protein MSAN_00824000 [Mycena sanguinolenta]
MDSESESPLPLPDTTKKCSKSSCKNQLPFDLKFTRCDHCREINRKNQKDFQARLAAKADTAVSRTSKKRRRGSHSSDDDRPTARPRMDPSASGVARSDESGPESDDDDDMSGENEHEKTVEAFPTDKAFYKKLRAEFKGGKPVEFRGTYPILIDALVSPRCVYKW